jgi:hypothetical protein
MFECIYVYVYRCLKLITCALLKCLISLHLEQVSTLTCITMDHNCELLMCYVVVNSGVFKCDRTHRMWYVATVRTRVVMAWYQCL